MSTATTTETALADGLGSKVRKTVIGAGFAMVLLVPKILNLRRNENSWTLFRTALGIFGAALVVLPLSIWNSYLFAVIGLAIFITAILLPPALTSSRTDDKARELGALIVVNGGLLQSSHRSVIPVQLFVGSENIWALDELLHPVLVIAVSELRSARAEELPANHGRPARWVLNLRWTDRSAIFSYSGVFAEHLAQVAERTIQSVIRPSLPVIPTSQPQRRAARA
jgi:hypothetical protein